MNVNRFADQLLYYEKETFLVERKQLRRIHRVAMNNFYRSPDNKIPFSSKQIAKMLKCILYELASHDDEYVLNLLKRYRKRIQ